MRGFIYLPNNGVGLFIESDFETRCKSIIDRINDLCNTNNIKEADIRKRVYKAELELTSMGVMVSIGNGFKHINEQSLVVQTLNANKYGRMWIDDTEDINVLVPNMYKSEPKCIATFKDATEAVDYMCKQLSMPFMVQLHYMSESTDRYYKIMNSLSSLTDVRRILWENRDKYAIMVSFIISGEFGTKCLRICTIKGNKLLILHDNDSDINKSKELKHSIVPQIIKVAKNQAVRNGKEA